MNTLSELHIKQQSVIEVLPQETCAQSKFPDTWKQFLLIAG